MKSNGDGEAVYVCLLPNDSGVVIPTWMFSAALCASMALGAPRASLRALIQARAILTEVGFHYSRTPAERRDRGKADANASTEKSVTARASIELEPNHEAGREKPNAGFDVPLVIRDRGRIVSELHVVKQHVNRHAHERHPQFDRVAHSTTA